MSINNPVSLANGNTIPNVGFGTFQTPPDETKIAVAEAIKAGYRHIDTAAIYGNEAGVGEAVRESGVGRGEFFITTKVWNTERGFEKTLAAAEGSLEKLGLDYVDLLLVHWPANYLQFGSEAKALNADTWRAFEHLYEQGRAKAIGVSNFMAHHLEALEETAKVRPMVNQIEVHPGWYQANAIKWCQDHDIVVEAWSPLGQQAVLAHPVLQEIADRHGKETAQVSLRWALQHGLIPLPKSVTPARIRSNTELFDFVLSVEEIQAIDKLENIGGPCLRPDDVLF
ncbi:aldo/keto reductase [Canibacter zhoujuaniae]|uniref:aldo/keto reductase n=1 Tax=Canibacter zhoujuaniae TaxID=2708343 RepID=UPI0014242C4E|nr:aldo/keto reductase [Canibacter zhoujuaniae]